LTIVLLLVTLAALLALNANYATAPALDEVLATADATDDLTTEAATAESDDGATSSGVHLVVFSTGRGGMSGVLPAVDALKAA
jgi:altronate dehydratase